MRALRFTGMLAVAGVALLAGTSSATVSVHDAGRVASRAAEPTAEAVGAPITVATLRGSTGVGGMLATSFYSRMLVVWWGRDKGGVALHGCLVARKISPHPAHSCTPIPVLRLGPASTSVDFARLDSGGGAQFGFIDNNGEQKTARLSPRGTSWSALATVPPYTVESPGPRGSSVSYDPGIGGQPLAVSVPAPAMIRDISSDLVGSAAAAGFGGTVSVAVVGDGWYVEPSDGVSPVSVPAVRPARGRDCDDRVALLPLGVCRTVNGLLVDATSTVAEPELHDGGGAPPLAAGLGSLTEATLTAGKVDAAGDGISTIVDIGQASKGLYVAARTVGDLDTDCEIDTNAAATYRPRDCTDSGESVTQGIAAATPGRVLGSAAIAPAATLVSDTSLPTVLAMVPLAKGSRSLVLQPIALHPVPATVPTG